MQDDLQYLPDKKKAHDLEIMSLLDSEILIAVAGRLLGLQVGH